VGDDVGRALRPDDGDTDDTTTIDGALALVRKHGGRVTSSRRFLLRVLFDLEGHHTAEELATAVQSKAPDVHLSTIYRNLEELERLGVIVHSHLGHGPATYHLASMAHGHLVCEACGKMIEAPDAIFAGLARSAEAKFGFVIDPHHFAVLGICTDCQ
jgi:Fe2+ or Zn2+ uptake regulation protein